MISRTLNFLLDLRDRQRIMISLAKGHAGRQARDVDLSHPASWEYSGFSQNGEDGIIDVLRSQLIEQNRYSIEIGFADGIENNTAWLISTANYKALGIEGNPKLVSRAQRTMTRMGISVDCQQLFVTKETVAHIWQSALYSDPDVLSLDIDGNDYHIADSLFLAGFRPKICVVEYNSALGCSDCLTIPYQEDFVFTLAHPSQLYYGVSIGAWKSFFAKHQYDFITVDENGVNAFFVDPSQFEPAFLSQIQNNHFVENAYQMKKYKASHKYQFEIIKDMPFQEI